MTESYTITYESHRCYQCGTYWAVELSRSTLMMNCPRCNHTRMRELTATADRQHRAINSLRGIITKLKKSKKPCTTLK